MKHRQWKEWLHLSFYDELTPGERQQFDMHIKECASCRKELEEIKHLHKILAQRMPAPVTEMQLQDARRGLRSAVLGERSRVPFVELFSAGLNAFLSPRWQMAAGSILLLAAGAAAGYLFFKIPESMNGFQAVSAGSTRLSGENRRLRISGLSTGMKKTERSTFHSRL